MSSEVSFDSTEFDDLDRYCQSSIAPCTLGFHEAIFALSSDFPALNRMVSFRSDRSETEKRTDKISQRSSTSPMGKVSAEGGISYEWGGDKGSGLSGYVSGSARDNGGNKAEVQVQVNQDGSGNVNVSVSHDEDTHDQ